MHAAGPGPADPAVARRRKVAVAAALLAVLGGGLLLVASTGARDGTPPQARPAPTATAGPPSAPPTDGGAPGGRTASGPDGSAEPSDDSDGAGASAEDPTHDASDDASDDPTDSTTRTVALGDDDTGRVLFEAPDLLPGQSGSRCLRVTYSGTVAATVRLFVESPRSDLADHLDLVVEQGQGSGDRGSFASCAGFSGATLFTGTLTELTASASSFGTGLGTWSPAGPGQDRVYRVSYTLSPDTPGSLQGAVVEPTFLFESRPAE